MAAVSYEHVDKSYAGAVAAVRDLCLEIADGELMVLVGPSGCGKSTALRLLAGLEEPSGGELRIGGRVVNALPPQARNVAMVFQDYALYPHMTVRENLEFPLKMRRMKREEMQRRVQWAAELLGMNTWLDRRPAALSGGQRQRAAMGRALVREPAVFLLDEPLSNIDARLRVQVRAELQDLQRRTGSTMIYVTHDQTEAMTLGQRVAVVHQGRLQQVAAPREMYERPANVFVAGFIGSPPMNLFPTVLSRAAGGGVRMTIGTQAVAIEPPAVEVPADGPMTAGVRPEALRIGAGGSDADTVAALVEQVEFLGHETVAYLRVSDGVRLVGRFPGTVRLTPGDALRLAVEPAGVHLFNADGARL